MHKHIWLASLFLTLAALWVAYADPEATEPELAATTTSLDLVQARATANGPDKGGRQAVQIHVNIAPGWHIYANPTGSAETAGAETKLTLSAPRGLRDQRITYPPGKRVADKQGDYFVYEGQAVIEAVVFRQPNDPTPLEAELRFQVCSKSQGRCVPGRLKLTLR